MRPSHPDYASFMLLILGILESRFTHLTQISLSAL